jgi:transcriptional regulator with XRE-family HTH domain
MKASDIVEFEVKLLRRVRLVRKKRKILQCEIASLLGMSQSAYSRMETGETPFPLRQFLIVCKHIEFPFVLFDGVQL